MKSRTLALGAVTGAFSAMVFASFAFATSASDLSFADSGTSSLKISPAVEGVRGEKIVKTETRYLEMGYPTDNFLKAVITTTRFTGAEGGSGSVAMQLLTNGKGRLDKVAWSAVVDGEKVEVFNQELIGVTTYGCCGSSDTTRLLNVTTGLKVEAAYGSIYQFEVPNTTLLKRYVSLAIDSKAPGKANGKTYVGTVSYYDANHIIARMRVYADLPSGWGTGFDDFKVLGGPKLQVNRDTMVTLWDNDGVKNPVAAYNGFAVESKLVYANQEETVRISINQDTIDAAASLGSKGLYLELVK